MYTNELIKACLVSNEEFVKTLRNKLKSLRISVKKFSEISSIPLSTLNKLFREKRDIRTSTFRQIINTIKSLEERNEEKGFIAVIAARPTLDKLKLRSIKINKTRIRICEYPVTNIESAIKAAIKAENDGASAIVCAPIVSELVKDVVSIPITSMYIGEKDLIKAIKHAAEKVRSLT